MYVRGVVNISRGLILMLVRLLVVRRVGDSEVDGDLVDMIFRLDSRKTTLYQKCKKVVKSFRTSSVVVVVGLIGD